MNMLQIQDALKNASDDQLSREMQNPSGMAPQFLVLGELKRRSDMRAAAQSQQQPQGTVADDLLSQNDGGISEIVAPDEPEAQDDDEEAMARGGIVGLRRYASGGAVHFEGGGSVNDNLDLTDDQIRAILDNRAPPRTATGRPWIFRNWGRGADTREQTWVEPTPQPFRAFGETQENANARARSNEELRAILEQRERDRAAAQQPVQPVQPAQPETPQVAQTDPAGQQPAQTNTQTPATTPPANTNTQPQPQPRPAPAAVAQAGGGNGAPGSDGQSDMLSGLQRLRDGMTDRISPLMERIQANRTDANARGSEAMNMALMEAGLRIAGSNSPRLAGAISEGGVPALQAYTQAKQQIRQDQRQDLRDELQTALAQNQRDYYLGRLTASELEMRNRYAIAQMQERGANARAAATNRNQSLELAEWINSAPNEAERERRLASAGRSAESAQTRNMNATLNHLVTEAEKISSRLATGILDSADAARERQRLIALRQRIDAVQNSLLGGGSFVEENGRLRFQQGGGR